MMACRSSAVAAALLAAVAQASTPVGRTTGGVRNTGYSFNRDVPYSQDAHGRRLTSTSWAPLRITVNYVAINALDAAKTTFFRDQLIPGVLDYLSKALMVVPVTGTLLHSRPCQSTYAAANVCGQAAAAPTCGLTDAGGDYTIPDSLLGALRVCTTCFPNPTQNPCTGCSETPAGAGADADFVMFLSAVQTSSCTGSSLAYAATCHRDQNDRPIFGYANFCPNSLNTATSAWADQLSTAVVRRAPRFFFSHRQDNPYRVAFLRCVLCGSTSLCTRSALQKTAGLSSVMRTAHQ